MKRINYSHNWNGKLDCDYHTTIRKYTEDKYKYYYNSIGETFEVFLKNEKKTIAKLVTVHKFNRNDLTGNTILKILVTLDTGLVIDEAIELLDKFGCKDEAILLLFKRIDYEENNKIYKKLRDVKITDLSKKELEFALKHLLSAK